MTQAEKSDEKLQQKVLKKILTGDMYSVCTIPKDYVDRVIWYSERTSIEDHEATELPSDMTKNNPNESNNRVIPTTLKWL